MVTPKNLIRDAKTDLGWDANDADYTSWRNNVKDYCFQKQIVSKTKAGEDKWQKCLADVPTLDGFKATMRTRILAGNEFHTKALEALVIDTLKKRSETTKKLALKRALKRPRVEDPENAEEADGPEENNAVALWIGDPVDVTHKNGMNLIWDSRTSRKLAILETRSLDAIVKAVAKYIPAGLTLREILGALEDLDPTNPGVPGDWTSLKSDA